MTRPTWSTLKHQLNPKTGRTNGIGGTGLVGIMAAGCTLEVKTKHPLRQADGQQPAPADWAEPPQEKIDALVRRYAGQPACETSASRPLEARVRDSLPADLRELVDSLANTPQSVSSARSSASSYRSSGPYMFGLQAVLPLTENEAALLVLAGRQGGPSDARVEPARELLGNQLDSIVAFCTEGRPLDDNAWKMLRALADSGAAGWAIVRRAADAYAGEGDDLEQSMPGRRVMLQCARALDPNCDLTLQEIRDRARAIVATGLDEHPQRFAARAMVALEHEGVRTPADMTAIGAVRNGLGDASAGSDFAFANARLSKVATWSNRATQPKAEGFMARVGRAWEQSLHKNPLGPKTMSGGENALKKLEPALVSMRATRESADMLSRIFGKLAAVGNDATGSGLHTGGDEQDSEVASVRSADPELARFVANAAYHHAVYDHWARRPVVEQQVMRMLSPGQKDGIKERITLAYPAPDTCNRLHAHVDALVLKPEDLQKTGWKLVGELRKAIERTDSAATGTGNGNGNGMYSAVVASLAQIQVDGSESGTALRTLEALEDALLGIRSEDSAKIEQRDECIRARKASNSNAPSVTDTRPLKQLADLVGKFEVGSSLTLTNGRAVGVTAPLALVNIGIPGPGGVAGEIKLRTGKEAVFSMCLSATGGEIVFGTMRRDLARAKVGGIGGIGGDHWKFGLGGTVGYTFEGSGTNAVVLRIPRTGKAIGSGHGEGRPGIEGDRIVANRMAQVLQYVNQRVERRETDGMVEALLAEFPEIQVTTQRDGRHSETTHKVSLEVAGGLGYVATDPPDAPEKDRRHGFSVFSGSLASEYSKRQTNRQENGPFRVEQRGTRQGVTVTGSGYLLGALPGSQSHLASVNRQTHNRFEGRIAKLAVEDGQPNENSALLEQAPSPASPHGRALLDKRIWELAEFKLGLSNEDTLKALVGEDLVGEALEGRIKALLKDKAYELTRAIENWPDTLDSNFLMFSKITPEARYEIGQLDALARLASKDPTLSKVAKEAEKARSRVVLDDGSYTASFAMRPAEHSVERSTGTPVLVAEKNRGAKVAGFGHVI